MTFTENLLVLTASNGENLKLAKRFYEIGKQLKAKPKLIDLTEIDLPLFNSRTYQQTGIPKEINSLHSEIVSIPRWVICAPEYNGSIPPILTNAIAWLSVQENDFRYLFNGRPIAMASFSGGGSMELLLSMRIQLTHLGAQVVGRQLASNYKNPPKDESIEDILQRLLQMEPLKV
tara:strand:- start:1041 stop:1565 length:525 start_codon:yes stop_codon:yes gene_type:complete